jgi:glycosyltransferase involved in cell wall biosynthesis
MPKLSIITINYNNLEGLKRTVESVVNQTWQEFEYIIIDGGSTDGSKEIIADYQKRITYWVSEKDNGIYHAMNKGINKSTGDFLIFMNSGDVFYNDTIIDVLVSELKNTDAIVYGDAVLRNGKKNTERIQTHPEKLNFSYFYKQTICQQACFIKRSLFDTIFYFNENYKITSDWEFLIYAIYIEKVQTRKIDVLISIYDTSGISGNPDFRQIATKEREQTINKYFPLYKEDYDLLCSYSSYRFGQLKQIEKSVFFRKLTSIIFKFITVMLPKKGI